MGLLDFHNMIKLLVDVHLKHSRFLASAEITPMSNDIVHAMSGHLAVHVYSLHAYNECQEKWPTFWRLDISPTIHTMISMCVSYPSALGFIYIAKAN